MRTEHTPRFHILKMHPNKALSIILCLVFVLGTVKAADSAPPELLTYQGYLTDSSSPTPKVLGESAPANYDVVFRIYDQKQSGSLKWTEQQTVTVDKGYFSVLLGEGSQVGNEAHGKLSAVFQGGTASDRFIEITVLNINNQNSTLAPRLRMVTAPYAFNAHSAVQVGEGSNSYFYRDNTSLKLGTGASPILELSSNGNSTLAGSLTTQLQSDGIGLKLNSGNSKSTTFGSSNGEFQISTSEGAYRFNKKLISPGLDINGTLESDEIMLSGWISRSAHNVGGLVGSYNNIAANDTKTNPIYAIGTSYKPNDSDLNNFYGIGYTHSNASFISGSASGWGLYLAADGDARTFLSGQAGDSYINRDGGRIGIGTSSPTETLDVNGTLRVRSYTYLRNRIYGTGSQYFYVNNAHDNGVEIVGHSHNNGRIGSPSVRWDDGYITELWADVQGSDRRLKKDIEPVEENQLLNLINKIPFYQYRLRFNDDEKMASQGRDPNGLYFGLLAQELRELYPNVVKSNGNYAELDENALDEETVRKNHWYVEKDRLAELALGGIKDLTALLEKKDAEIEALQSKTSDLETELKALKSQVAEILAERN